MSENNSSTPAQDFISKEEFHIRIGQVALVVSLALLALLCIRNIYSYDYWWHIASGRWILDNGIMRGDPFSFTAKGAALVDPYWLAQIILYALGGAVVVFKTIIIVAAFVIALRAASGAAKNAAPPLPAAVLVLLGAFVANERFLCRPEIFTLLFTGVTLWVLFVLSKRNRYAVFAIVGLTVLWVNMHPGWLMAPLLLGTFGAGRLFGRLLGFSADSGGNREDLLMLGAAGLCFIAALANPYFAQLVAYPFRLTLTSAHDVGEFLEWGSPIHRLSEGIFSLSLIHFKILALILVGSFVLNYKRFNFGHAAVAVFVLMLALKSYRHSGVFALGAIPITLANIRPFWTEQLLPRLSTTRLKFVHIGAVIAIVATGAYYCEEVITNHYYAKRELYNMSFGIGVSDTSFPFAAVPPSSRAYTNRIFNSYELGGYLIHSGYPQSEVFIDGRLVHYSKEVYDDYRRVQAAPQYWDAFVRKYRINSVVLIHNLPRMQRLIKQIHKSSEWILSGVDGVACQYCRQPWKPEMDLSTDDPLATTYPAFTSLSLGRFYLNVGDDQKAVDMLKGAAAKYPDNGKVHLFYGRALAGIGKVGQVRYHLEKAVQLLPRSVDAHMNLGVAYWKMGRKEEARSEWRRVLELEPRNEQALRYLELSGK